MKDDRCKRYTINDKEIYGAAAREARIAAEQRAAEQNLSAGQKFARQYAKSVRVLFD